MAVKQNTHELRASLAAGVLTGVCLIAVVVMSRRMSGAAGSFASASAALAVASAVMLVGAFSLPPLHRKPHWRLPEGLLQTAACLCPGFVLGLALLPPSSSAGLASLMGLFGILLATTVSLTSPISVLRKVKRGSFRDVAAIAIGRSAHDATSPEWRSDDRPGQEEPARPTHSPPAAMACDDGFNEDALPDEDSVFAIQNDPSTSEPSVTQWMRRTASDGQEMLEGGIKAAFTRGVKQTVIHIPFSPPFATAPEVEIEPLDESDVEVRATAVHAFGMRVEVTRDRELDCELVVDLGYVATSRLSRLDAAAA